MQDDIKHTRNNYDRNVLLEGDVAGDPFDQFSAWLEGARVNDIRDYNAFTLSTVSESGFPDARIVLLRGADKSGLTFFTNYNSAKGREIHASEKVCMNFFWNTLERQIRILGIASQVSAEESDVYFNSRPRDSRIAAWASSQSSELRTRDDLDAAVLKYTAQFEEKEVPRPPHWGGYRIVPHYFEFWQGRPNRLHDRLVYELQADKWSLKRLAP